MDVFEKLKIKIREIESAHKVKRLGIFGSFAAKGASEESDVDVLVEFSEPVDIFEFLDLKEYLETLLDRKVDLVTPRALKPLIKDQILQEVVYI